MSLSRAKQYFTMFRTQWLVLLLFAHASRSARTARTRTTVSPRSHSSTTAAPRYLKTPEHYFMNAYQNQYGPGQFEFGHICENPTDWEERFERRDDIGAKGKVRWGDAHGGYGEHYWDFNHGGQTTTSKPIAFENDVHGREGPPDRDRRPLHNDDDRRDGNPGAFMNSDTDFAKYITFSYDPTTGRVFDKNSREVIRFRPTFN